MSLTSSATPQFDRPQRSIQLDMRLGLFGGRRLVHRITRGRSSAAAAAACLLLFASATKTAHGFRCLSSTSINSARGGGYSRIMSASTHAGNGDSGVRLPEPLLFGPYPITEDQVFYSSQLSMGIVNLKPIVPGHVLVMPHRVAVRFADLSPEEVADLYRSVHDIAPRLEQHFGGKALTISIQDGAAAGQTVPVSTAGVSPPSNIVVGAAREADSFVD